MSFLHELLNYYHLTIKDLDAKKASGSFLSLKNPFDLPDFKKVIERINQAITKKEKVVLYGDYDVDGLTSVAILKLALEEKGLNTAFFIPSRYIRSRRVRRPLRRRHSGSLPHLFSQSARRSV